MKFKRKFFFLPFVFIILVTISNGIAQEYPTRAIDIVVPFAAGGGVDSFFRTIREPLSNELKVPINVINRPGGGGVIGSSFVANSKPDGYTILGQDITSVIAYPIITPEIPFNILKDFQPIVSCAILPQIIAVRTDLGLRKLEDLISYAKKNPGKLLVGTAGVGSSPHFNVEIFKKSAGIDITHFPLGGGGEVIPNILGGHIDLTVIGLSIIKSHMRAGKLQGLLTLSPERIPDFPEIPTSKEKGMPEVNINNEPCFLGPKGLPIKVTERLTHAVSEILKSPELVANLSRLGYFVNFLPSDQLGERIKKEFQIYLEVAKKAGFAKIRD